MNLQNKISGLILFCLAVIFTPGLNAQIRGSQGITVYPKTVNMSSLPNIGVIDMGPVFKSKLNKGITPQSEIYPVPNAENLPRFTFDLNSNLSSTDAPTVGTNFEGITQSGYIPSEPQPAAGPNHIVILGNVSIKITDKSGTVLQNVLQSSFFGIPSGEEPGFDGKCFYDARNGRFLLLTETQNSLTSTSNYYLAISQTNDAMGSWYIYTLDMTIDGTTQSTNWADFPGLGLSSDKIVLSGQQYSFSTNSYRYQKLRVLDRSAAYSGSITSYVDFYNWSGQRFVTKPGRNVSVSDTIHLLTTPNTGGTSFYYRRLTGTPSSPVLSGETSVTVSSYSIPPNAPGGSASITINTGDSRTSDFFVRDGILYSAIHCGVNINGGSTESVIKFVKIQVSPLSTTPLTDETYGAENTFYYYPMVCADSVGTVFLGFGKSSTSEYPSTYITGKRRGDASLQSSTLIKAGTAVTSQTRWGDYSGIDMDESASGNTVSYAWYTGQWTKTSSTFGTWANQMSYTYGKISGQVLDDTDGDVSTTGDRTGISGATVTLKQGSTTIATTTSDGSGNYNIGYLETASNYSIEFTPPSGRFSVDVIAGSGGNSQVKTNYKTIAVNLTDAQTSSGNNFIVSDWVGSVTTGNWNSSATWADNTSPSASQKIFINSGHTVTINTNVTCGSINKSGSLQFDNVTNRSLTINNQIFISGTIAIGNNSVIIGSGATISGASSSNYFITDGSGTLTRNNIGASGLLFPVGLSNSFNPVTISNSGTADNFSVRVQNSITPPPVDTSKIIKRMWTITESAAGGSNASVTLQYNSSDCAGSFNNSAGVIAMGRHNGSVWIETSAVWSNPSPNVYTATATGYTSFSPFIIGNSGALPVTISYFNSRTDKRNVTLLWGTSNEINNSGFEIERYDANKNGAAVWGKISFINGNGTTSEPHDYSFTDSRLASGNYKYRLKQIDYNGSFEYHNLNSDVVIGTPGSYNISQNYPNPSNPKSKIDYEIPASGKVVLQIYDVTGQQVTTLVDKIQDAGYYTAEFDGTSLASGIYFYRLTSQNFSMVKKMVLVK